MTETPALVLFCGHREGHPLLALEELLARPHRSLTVVDDLCRDSLRREVEGRNLRYRSTPCLGWAEACARALDGLGPGPVWLGDDRWPGARGLLLPAPTVEQLRGSRSLAELAAKQGQPLPGNPPLVSDTALGMLTELEECLDGGGPRRAHRALSRIWASGSFTWRLLGLAYLAYWAGFRPLWRGLNGRFQRSKSL